MTSSRPALLSICLALAGCAGMVVGGDADTVVIEHDFFIPAESARAIAQASCEQSGKRSADHSATVNKNPRLPRGHGVQLSTFRCV